MQCVLDTSASALRAFRGLNRMLQNKTLKFLKAVYEIRTFMQTHHATMGLQPQVRLPDH